MAGLSSFLTALNVAGNVANTIGTFAGAAKNVAGAFGGWGQTGNSQSSGGSIQQGGGKSKSGSQAGTNNEQVDQWLNQAYAYQREEAAMQGKYNSQSMLKQMGYNTLQAIMQGVYNHIENSVAMSYNSAEALANREWQEHMSNTAYQRAVEDMRKAGLNPILAFANGGASTPGGSAGTISGASMGLASSSALGVSRSGGFVPNSYESSSWSESEWYSAAQSWQQMLSTTHMSPYGLQKTLTNVADGTGKAIEKATEKATKTEKKGRKQEFTKPQDKTGKYGEKRNPGDYLK